MSKVIIAATTLNLANDMLANDLSEVAVKQLSSDANILAEAIGEKTLKKDKNRDAAEQRLKDNAMKVIAAAEGKGETSTESASEDEAPVKAEPKKKAVGKKKVASPRRKAIEYKVKKADGEVSGGKLINSVPAGEFKDVEEIVVDRELNEKAYFCTAYFEKRGVKVNIKPEEFETEETTEEPEEK